MKVQNVAIFSILFSLVAGRASAVDGTIHFTGKVLADACTVNSVAGSGTSVGTVDFGTISANSLLNPGDSTGGVPFSIELKDCAVNVPPKITFTANSVSTSGYTELFSTTINGIGIRLEDAADVNKVYQNGVSTQNTGFETLGSGVSDATGSFNAKLVSYNAGQKIGNIDNDITFIIDYSDL